MTFEMKLEEERRSAREEGLLEHILALKGALPAEVLAEKFGVPVERVLAIWGQNKAN